jgi:hypothetical protein
MTRFTRLVIALVLAMTSHSAHAVVYDWIEGIDGEQNPSASGLWSYGSMFVLGSTFEHAESSTATTYDGEYTSVFWLDDDSQANLEANVTPNWVFDPYGGGRAPNSMTLHPGSSSEYAVLRFTAPIDDAYTFDITFTGNSSVGTSSDAAVLVNGATMFSGAVTSARVDQVLGVGQHFVTDAPLQLSAGSTIDIAVGAGGNGYAYDLTGISGWIAGASGPNGDYNGDGNFTAADLAVWKAQFATPSVPAEPNADGDDDGAVNGTDFLIWQRTLNVPGVQATASAVPEPGCIAIVATTLAPLAAMRRRRRS